MELSYWMDALLVEFALCEESSTSCLEKNDLVECKLERFVTSGSVRQLVCDSANFLLIHGHISLQTAEAFFQDLVLIPLKIQRTEILVVNAKHAPALESRAQQIALKLKLSLCVELSPTTVRCSISTVARNLDHALRLAR